MKIHGSVLFCHHRHHASCHFVNCHGLLPALMDQVNIYTAGAQRKRHVSGKIRRLRGVSFGNSGQSTRKRRKGGKGYWRTGKGGKGKKGKEKREKEKGKKGKREKGRKEKWLWLCAEVNGSHPPSSYHLFSSHETFTSSSHHFTSTSSKVPSSYLSLGTMMNKS